MLVEKATSHDSAIKLSAAVGGRQYRVPNKPSPKLIEYIGETASNKLCQELGSLIVMLPSTVSIDRMQRAERIKIMLAEGANNNAIAHETGVSVHWVRKQRKEHVNNSI
jgi:DNA-binding NarL/FixJ family response regulator